MNDIQATQAGLEGIRRNLERFDRAAQRLSRAPRGDLAGDLVDLKISKIGVQAGVKVVQAVDEMIGTLLDVIR
jgi:hypothetical protein